MNLTASYLTLAGAAWQHPAANDPVARSDAAHAAGYTSIGAGGFERGVNWAQVARLTRSCPVTELEWFDLATSSRADGHAMARIAETLGTVDRFNVGADASVRAQVPNHVFASRVAWLAKLALPLGVTVAVEPVSFGPGWQPGRIANILAMAGQPNTGIIWDTWQMSWAAAHGARAHIPLGMIAEVQLAGYVPGFRNPQVGAMTRAMVDAPARAMITRLCERGYGGPVDVEVTNPGLRAMAVTDAARATYPAGMPAGPREGMPLSHSYAALAAMAGHIPAFMNTPNTRLALASFGVTS